MLNIIYTLLKQQLDTIQDIEMIDWHLDQFNQTQDEAVVITPAVYVKFQDIPWETYPDNIQKGVLTFELHLVTETAYGDDRDMLDSEYINHIGIENKIFVAMQGEMMKLSDHADFTSLDNTTDDRLMIETINRIESQPHHKLNNLIHTVQVFESVIFDYNACPDMQKVLVTFECKGGLDTELNKPKTWNTSEDEDWKTPEEEWIE